MSTSIKIQNFQSIESADIQADGFTILVGESSQGKSACLRAVNAACNNRFRQNYLKYGEETMTVEIGYNDEGSFKTTKNKKDSPTYSLNGTPYEKLNRTVPQEIQDFNNHGVIDYYEQKYPLNFFSQFSKPLLLEFSQKRILEILSSSKAYDDMTKASSNLNRHKEQNGGAFKQVNVMLDTNKARLSELKALCKGQTPLVDTLKKLMSDAETAEAQISASTAIETLLSESDTVSARLSAYEGFIGLVRKYNVKQSELERINELRWVIDTNAEDSLNALNGKLSLCDKIKELIRKRDGVGLERLRDLSDTIQAFTSGKKRFVSLEDDFKRINALREGMLEMEGLKLRLGKIGVLNDTIKAYSDARDTLRQKEHVLTDRICPVCGSKLG